MPRCGACKNHHDTGSLVRLCYARKSRGEPPVESPPEQTLPSEPIRAAGLVLEPHAFATKNGWRVEINQRCESIVYAVAPAMKGHGWQAWCSWRDIDDPKGFSFQVFGLSPEAVVEEAVDTMTQRLSKVGA